jgi:hypothetical protein
MLAAVDAHLLVDALVIRVVRVELPPLFKLQERQGVRSIAIDLVGRAEDERGLRTEPPRVLEHDERPVGVDGEVRIEVPGGPIVPADPEITTIFIALRKPR